MVDHNEATFKLHVTAITMRPDRGGDFVPSTPLFNQAPEAH